LRAAPGPQSRFEGSIVEQRRLDGYGICSIVSVMRRLTRPVQHPSARVGMTETSGLGYASFIRARPKSM
jgi:hypothetical protein